MQIYLIRHGETDWNLNDQLQGQADTPLNDQGRRQALETAQKLKELNIHFDRVISSPLDRAIETAEIISQINRENFEIDDRLMEISYGPLEGTHFEDIPKDMFAFFRDPVHVAAPAGIEAISDVIKRQADFIEALRIEHSDDTVLISTHGIAMRGMIGYLANLHGKDIWTFDIHNCAIYQFELNNHHYTKPRLFL